MVKLFEPHVDNRISPPNRRDETRAVLSALLDAPTPNQDALRGLIAAAPRVLSDSEVVTAARKIRDMLADVPVAS